MKKLLSIMAVALLLLVTGCTSYKNVPYLQNSNEVDLSTVKNLYDAKIMPKDMLTITVSCPTEPKTTALYNLIIPANSTVNAAGGTAFSSQVSLMSYIVSNDGYIDFPVLGQIRVLGMTKTELEKYISDEIKKRGSLETPIVLVNMASFKISVIGEVSRPGTFTIANGKVNIFEALAYAGDMTIYGRRDCVRIIREDFNGEKKVVELNLNDANVILSPYYQLQQNDVVIVTPNKVKSKNSGIGSETSLWFTSTSILVSLASLLYNILK